MADSMNFQKLDINNIQFDPENPRIAVQLEKYGDAVNEDRIIVAMQTCPGYRELETAILSADGILMPIIVIPNESEGNTYTCIDGNARLAIYRRLVVDNDKWKKIPALVCIDADQRTIEQFRLTAHVAGKREWPTYEKDEYFHRLKYTDVLSDEEIVDLRGGNKKDIIDSRAAYEERKRIRKQRSKILDEQLDPTPIDEVSNYEKGIRKLVESSSYTEKNKAEAYRIWISSNFYEGETVLANQKRKGEKGDDLSVHAYFAFEMNSLRRKKREEHKAGRFVDLHECLGQRWCYGSDQWKVKILESQMKEGRKFYDILSLLDKHKYFVVKKKYSNYEGDIFPYSIKGFGALHRKMSPRGTPEIKQLLIQDYLKLQGELGLPLAILPTNPTEQMFAAAGIEYLFHIYGSLASVRYMDDLLAQRTAEIGQVKTIKVLEAYKNTLGNLHSRLNDTEDNPKNFYRFYSRHFSRKSLAWTRNVEDYPNTSFDTFHGVREMPDQDIAELKGQDSLEENIIFFSAVKRMREVEGISDEQIYTLLIYLYEQFAAHEGWNKSHHADFSRDFEGVASAQRRYGDDDKYLFAEWTMYGTPLDHEVQLLPYHANLSLREYSEFLCNVEEFEEKKGEWKSLEHFYRNKYFADAKKAPFI